MSKTILLFPGQGSQAVGMGKTFTDVSAAAELLAKSSDIMNIDMEKLLFSGPEEQLKQTQFTQPALFTVSMMAFECFKQSGISFDCVAGHSLGEYSALCAAGVFSFEEGLSVVKKRGELMAKAGEVRPGAMTAVLGLNAETLDSVVKSVAPNQEVVVANYNSLSQMVISGEVTAIEKTEQMLKEAGAKKVIRLPVSGAFHSPLMSFAVEGLQDALQQVSFKDASVGVISNIDAKLRSSSNELQEAVLGQLTAPVRWVASIQNAIEFGCTQGYELGSMRVLMGLIRGISRQLKVGVLDSLDAIQSLT